MRGGCLWKGSLQGLQSQPFGPAILLKRVKSAWNNIGWLENYLTLDRQSFFCLSDWMKRVSFCHSKNLEKGKKLNRSSPSQKGLVSLAPNWHKYSSLGFCLLIVIKYFCLWLHSQMTWLMSRTICPTLKERGWNYVHLKCFWLQTCVCLGSVLLYIIYFVHQM